MKKNYLMRFMLVWCIAIASIAWAQERVVTGKVSATEDGSALPGVNVVLRGTTNGTVTDSNGSYKLNIPSRGGSLVFSFIGLQTQEIEIGDRSVVDISLTLDVQQLSEVVVTGTGVATDKKKLAIAVESISADKLPATPSASIDQALIGKIAGAQISSVSGNPGDPINILLRGINTVQGGTQPLIMVDGVQAGATNLNSLDLSNVERIEVVQGAASASIYGAQGANGVIQIFTKKGKKGKLSVDFSTSYAQNQFLNVGGVKKANLHPYLTDASNNIIDVASGKPLQYTDYGAIEGISYEYGGGPTLSSQQPRGTGGDSRYANLDQRNINNKPYDANLKYYDHFKQVFKTGYTVNNSINLSGGSDKNDFAVTVSNNRTKSPILNNGALDRTNVTANIGFEVFKGLKIRSVTQAIYTLNDMVPGLGGAGGAGYGRGNVGGNVGAVYGFLNTAPFFDLTRKMVDGNYAYYQTADFLSVNSANPYYYKQYATGEGKKVDILQNININYKVNKFFELDAKYGYNYRTENARRTYSNQSGNLNSVTYDPNYIGVYAGTNEGEIINDQYSNTFQNFLGTGYFRTDLQEDFGVRVPISLSTMIGFDHRKREYTEFTSYGTAIGLYPPTRITNAQNLSIAADYIESFVTYGYLVNQKIDFGDFGGISGGFRSDWSSAFGAGSKPFTFPNVSGYLLASTLWKDKSLSGILPYLKVRAAFGKAGIQPGPFDRFPTLKATNLGGLNVYSIPGNAWVGDINNTALQNKDIRVEVSTETEIGTDFSVNALKGDWLKTIGGSFTYWQRNSDDVIYAVNLPPSSGTPNYLTNAIKMSSTGFQFSLNLPILASSSLKWDLTTNFGHQLSKIDGFKVGSDIILTSSAGSTSLVLTPGAPIGQIYGYKALTSLDATRKDGTRFIAAADESKYEIVDGRVVNKQNLQIQFSNEQVPIGHPNPKFNMSFVNSISFKEIVNLSFQLDWIQGSKLYNQTKEWMYRDGIHSDFTKPVTINGQTAAFTAYHASAYQALFGTDFGPGNNATKDYFFENSSFVRLRNISLSFDAAKILKLEALRKLQLVLTGRNILTFTKYTGYDPEVNSSATVNSSFDRGVDNSTLPNIRSYQIGLNIGF
jgi:TonB-linked SusC/RagA family outer membrane protein